MEKTIENNKLLAEFLGVKETFQGAFEMYGVIAILDDGENEQHFYFPSELKFHSDWNWLMEVVEKIETTPWSITQTKPYLRNKDRFKGTTSLCGEFIVGYDDREEFKGWTSYIALGTLPSIIIRDFENRFNTKIEAFYNACIEFVKWLDENYAKEN